MAGYTKLFSDIITSSIWNEDDKTRIVWITLLALSDATGYVHCAMPSLALMARVDQEACLAAIGRLEGPDEHSRTPENDGRRISKVDGGWVILNYEKHRNRLSDDPDTIYHREYMRKIREKHQKKLTKLTCINPASASASASDKDRGEYERGKKPKPTNYSADFEAFWQAYPRKVGKGDAFKAWQTKNHPIVEELLKVLAQHKESGEWDKEDGQFIPHPATWLRQERWNDELKPKYRSKL